jgi:hypothetical protein
MNYFAHGYRFVDEPYFLAGTAMPDWMRVIDRKARARSKWAEPLAGDSDEPVAALARGIVQHHHDDRWFHQTRVFTELSLELTIAVRELVPGDSGMRPSFLGHVLVELLLDAELIADHPGRIDAYYAALQSLDGRVLRAAAERMTNAGAEKLPDLLAMFCRERFLCDYADDAKLLMRLERVMRRVGLPPVPPELRDILPAARRRVRQRKTDLLLGEAS